uniref:XRE family transcriptional regulator n=1 Tax=Ascaris lumbricoides TaxID=6252 RepID=A0A0M3IJE5_ASCLU
MTRRKVERSWNELAERVNVTLNRIELALSRESRAPKTYFIRRFSVATWIQNPKVLAPQQVAFFVLPYPEVVNIEYLEAISDSFMALMQSR